VTGRRDLLARERRLLVLAIGQGLRAEYAGVQQPLPESLSALIRQLEERPRADENAA
jgi:hypothetical protein